MKKLSLTLFSWVLHLLAAGVIFYFWRPILSWYWNYRPILGVDFYNFASYLATLARDFAWRFSGWKYIWHGGYPWRLDYPTLSAYLNLPLLSFFSLPQAVQAYMLVATFLFLFFSYLTFWELSRSRVLAVVLTIGAAFSSGIYGALIWGGSLPYYSSQFFLPLTLWLLIKYLRTENHRWLWLASLFLGFSLFGHFQVALSYAAPIIFLLLATYPFAREKIFSFIRWRRIFLFFATAFVIGYPQIGLYLGKTPMAILFEQIGRIVGRVVRLPGATSQTAVEFTSSPQSSTAVDIAQFNKEQIGRFFSETNPSLFGFLILGLIFFLAALMISKERRRILKSLVFALPVVWVVAYDLLLAFGMTLYHGGWYRVFWPFPLALGILTAAWWAQLLVALESRIGFIKSFSGRLVYGIIISVLVVLSGLFFINGNGAEKMLANVEVPRLRQQSSAFPDSLNVYISAKEITDLKKKLVPSWLDPHQRQYRLYEPDQRVNIWWNAFFDMPLVKGYIDPPGGDGFGGFYWMDVALVQFGGVDQLVKTWGTPPEIAYNNALFLLDWFSVKYLELEHEKSDSYNPPTTYLSYGDIFEKKEKVIVPGWAQLYARKLGEAGPILWHPDEEEHLTYYEVKNELVSPIVHASNAPAIGVIGTPEAYGALLRILAAVNLNSQKIVPLQLGRHIDDVSDAALAQMETVIIYGYDYRNQAVWEKLNRYVKKGGRVLVETGSEVKETDSINLPANFPKVLPDIFPFPATKTGEMGTSWRLDLHDGEEVTGINQELFAPPLLDGKPWVFSLPATPKDLREGALVLVENKGIPLMIKRPLGQGVVIWSGMNLPYHMMVHKNLEEARFFQQLLEVLVPSEFAVAGRYSVARPSAQKVVITGNKARGVFFREQAYPGWQAKINVKYKNENIKKELKIYRAGPAYPGFMYAIIPKEAQDGEFTITFSFSGEFSGYFWQFISLLVVFLIFDIVFFNSRFLYPIAIRLTSPVSQKLKSWWGKDEDY